MLPWLFVFTGGLLIAVCRPRLYFYPRNAEAFAPVPVNPLREPGDKGKKAAKIAGRGGNHMRRIVALILVATLLAGCSVAPASLGSSAPEGKEIPGLTWESSINQRLTT